MRIFFSRTQPANTKFSRAQTFQRLPDYQGAKPANQHRAGFLNVPATLAEIARGKVKAHRQNKDKRNGADALHQAAEKGTRRVAVRLSWWVESQVVTINLPCPGSMACRMP